jgi:hypothetical protein
VCGAPICWSKYTTHFATKVFKNCKIAQAQNMLRYYAVFEVVGFYAYLEILVSELIVPFPTSLVDDLSHSNDLPIVVADWHAHQ